jgi:hypothetical protein
VKLTVRPCPLEIHTKEEEKLAACPLARPPPALQGSEAWGLRMAILKCMMLLVTGFSRLAAPHIGPALTAAWQVGRRRSARETTGLRPALCCVVCACQGPRRCSRSPEATDVP